MASSKQLLFGSLFQFGITAIDEVIARFRSLFTDRSAAPFIQYDQDQRLFCITVNRNDEETANHFLKALGGYIRSKEADQDNLVDQHGMVLDERLHISTTGSRNWTDLMADQLIDDGSDTSSNNLQMQNSREDVLTWEPVDGNTEILTRVVEDRIKELTGTLMWRDLTHTRIRLIYGNVEATHTKLCNLDWILSTISKQDQNSPPTSSATLILPPRGQRNPSFKLMPVVHDQSSIRRIITNNVDAQHLAGRSLCQLLNLDAVARACAMSTPDTLATAKPQASRIWKDFYTVQIGEASDAEPQISGPAGASPVDRRSGQAQSMFGVSEIGRFGDVHRSLVTAWTQQVSQTVDPADPLSGTVISDTTAPPGPRRVIIALPDSDDEDEDSAMAGIEPGAEASDPLSRFRRAFERKSSFDEEDGRVFHLTMNQKARNPGRRKNRNKAAGPRQGQESAPDREARIQRAKMEAYPPFVSHKKNTVDLFTSDLAEERDALDHQTSTPSMNKKQHPGVDQLINTLSPIFDAARAFAGDLTFELQFGQVLFPTIKDEFLETGFTLHELQGHLSRSYRGKEASELFIEGLPTFTNLLTVNGAEIDHFLQMKMKTWGVSSPFWSDNVAGTDLVTYEFHCKGKLREDFRVIVQQSGTYSLTVGQGVIGMVNLCFPGQVWDACAVVRGSPSFASERRTMARVATELADSIYIEGGHSESPIFFRISGDNEVSIQDVFLKRISKHRTSEVPFTEFELHISEIQRLRVSNHPTDRTLWQASGSHDSLVRDGCLHYEISLRSAIVNQAFEQNHNLELGELTDSESTGQTLLSQQHVTHMLDLATVLVANMEHIGRSNIGTLIRHELDTRMSQLSQPRSSSHGHANPQMISPEKMLSEVPDCSPDKVVPGIRSKTMAGTIEGEGGRLWKCGIGGAKVPVPLAEITADDSASQAGHLVEHGRLVSTISSKSDPKQDEAFW